MNPRLQIANLEEHPLRQRLNNEFHARPPIPIVGPVLVSHLVFKCLRTALDEERANLTRLCQVQVCNAIESSDAHLLLDAGSFRMRWELHTEFSSYTFFRPLVAGETLHPDTTAFDAVLPEWLAAIPGKLMIATHVEMRSAAEVTPESVLAALSPSGRQMVAAKVADGAAFIFTDFKIDNGFSRFLILDVSLTQRQALSSLSALAAEVEHSIARTTFRFGASAAYHGLVMQRIAELRESRISGLPTFDEFSMNSCSAACCRR